MRARNLKPGFFKNPDLADLPAETRLLFAGLWCLADAEGRLKDDHRVIKAEIFPYDDFDTEKMLSALALSPGKFIQRYKVDHQKIIQIRNFDKHQNPHVREKQKGSDFPACSVPAPDLHCASTELAGRNPESCFLNPESSSPPPEPSEKNLGLAKPEAEDDFSEKPPKTPKHAGVYFDIDLRGDQLGEEEWLYRCMLEQRRSKNMSVMGCDSLRALLELYPNHKEHYRRWVTLPIEMRMAAFAYTYLKARASDPLAFAMWLVSNRQSGDPKLAEFPKYLAAAKVLVDKKELKVIVDE